MSKMMTKSQFMKEFSFRYRANKKDKEYLSNQYDKLVLTSKLQTT